MKRDPEELYAEGYAIYQYDIVRDRGTFRHGKELYCLPENWSPTLISKGGFLVAKVCDLEALFGDPGSEALH